jgi:hypothetical protein
VASQLSANRFEESILTPHLMRIYVVLTHADGISVRVPAPSACHPQWLGTQWTWLRVEALSHFKRSITSPATSVGACAPAVIPFACNNTKCVG